MCGTGIIWLLRTQAQRQAMVRYDGTPRTTRDCAVWGGGYVGRPGLLTRSAPLADSTVCMCQPYPWLGAADRHRV